MTMSDPALTDPQTYTPTSIILPVVLVLLAGIWSSAIFAARRRRRLPFPPGPRGLPLIGNLHMLDQLNHRGLATIAESHGNPGLIHLRLGHINAFAVSTPAMAQQVLQVQDQAFSNRSPTLASRYLTYDVADMAFANYGPFWRQMRKLCIVRLFSRRRAVTWESVRDEVDKTTRAFAALAGTEANVGEMVYKLTQSITFRAAFGTRTSVKDQEKLIAIIHEFRELLFAFNVGDFFPWLRWLDLNGITARLLTARVNLDRFIDRIIDDHMANRKAADAADTDMVDEMLVYLKEDSGHKHDADAAATDDVQGTLQLRRDNIKAMIMDVMFGGTETIASAIEWAMAELLRNPADLTKVQNELEVGVGLDRMVDETDLDRLPYLRCCIKETLRLHPPISLPRHETVVDCDVEGYAVPARSLIMVNIWAINRDKDAWGDDASEFRPGRFDAETDAAKKEPSKVPDFGGGCFQYLPFGSGRRSCPGMQLGLYALELAVAQLVHCFRWELPGGMKPAELDMTEEVLGITAGRTVRLVAIPTPRLTCPIG